MRWVRRGYEVKYVNHYPPPDLRKFWGRYLGPSKVVERHGVNYKIERPGARGRWVHHDEIFLWIEKDQAEDEDEGFISETSQEFETPGAEDSPRLSRSPRPVRLRRRPVWWEDFVTD